MSLPHYHAETDLNAENLLTDCPRLIPPSGLGLRRAILFAVRSAACSSLTLCVLRKSLFEHFSSYPALNARAGRLLAGFCFIGETNVIAGRADPQTCPDDIVFTADD